IPRAPRRTRPHRLRGRQASPRAVRRQSRDAAERFPSASPPLLWLHSFPQDRSRSQGKEVARIAKRRLTSRRALPERDRNSCRSRRRCAAAVRVFPLPIRAQSRPHRARTSFRGEPLMTRLRYHHMLAGTALAAILAAIPLGGLALEKSKTAPGAESPAEQTSTEASSPAPAATAESVTITEPVVTTTTPEPAAAPESTVTADQAVVVDPMALLDPADRPIAEKIRDLFAAPSDRIFGNKKERAAAEAFYQSRNYLPLWLDKGLENARATSAIARLKNADSDGLEASDYKTPNFAGLTGDTLAESDLKLTQAGVTS